MIPKVDNNQQANQDREIGDAYSTAELGLLFCSYNATRTTKMVRGEV